MNPRIEFIQSDDFRSKITSAFGEHVSRLIVQYFKNANMDRGLALQLATQAFANVITSHLHGNCHGCKIEYYSALSEQFKTVLGNDLLKTPLMNCGQNHNQETPITEIVGNA